jgi:cell pole-organizing protein PopZ
MSDTNAQEPTMEEILASIRRIISEDDAPAAAAPEAESAPAEEPEPAAASEPFQIDEGDEDDVLELTEPAPPLKAPEPAPVAAPAPAPAPAESLGDLDVFSRPEPKPEPRPAYAPVSLDEDDGLTGAPTADHAASMFGQLSRTLAMPAEGRTLEDVVRELLRPMLKQWLDTNLPSIVETAVQAEVERISRRRSI